MIIGAVMYFTFLSQLAVALGYAPASLANFTQAIGSIDVGILSFLFDIVAWVVSSVGTYFCMIGFTVTGDIPVWLGAFFITPVGLGVGWLVLDLVRG
jgi:hypothetical protein